MTTFYLTCEAVEATLPDYLDETLEPWVRASIEEHLGECWRCAGLARELRNITREASALPALVPERDPWGEIAGRIGAPVSVATPVAESEPLAPSPEPIGLGGEASLPIVESSAVASEPPVLISEPPPLADEPPVVISEAPALADEPPVVISEPPPLTTEAAVPTTEPAVPAAPASEPLLPLRPARVPKATPVHALSDRRAKRWGPGRLGLAAAALVLVTAGTTSLFTVQWLRRARAPSVASARGLPSSERAAAEPGIRAPDSSIPTLPAGQVGSALTVAATSAPQVTRSPEEAVYDKEINMLQGVVRRQRGGLDASTVVVIEKNVRAIDSAIAQIRAAMQKDPGNAMLGGQASRALEMKVELLRRAAMLRSST